MIWIMGEQLRRRLLRMLWALYIILGIWHSSAALTVDNQLVSARNDCFERIALEAMLPFEKTFRTEDTNSLKMCKEKCLQAGEKCQAISFGVHRRGNGTCQLSSEQYGSGGAGRPGGVIFDPDFDLYTRKTNCFDLSDNAIAPGSGPSPISHGPTPANLPNRPLDVGNTPVLVVNPNPTSHTDEPPLRLPTISTPSVGPGPGAGPGPSPSLPPPPGLGDRLYFSHDLYPLYKYPALYENNYPAPNEDVYIPGGYAANAPEVEDHYHRPHYGPPSLEEEGVRPTPHGPPRPIFGLGYGNGYSYGSPERYTPPTMRPPSASSDDRPQYAARPPSPDYPSPPPRPYDTDSSTPQSYGPRPSPSYEPHREPRPDYTNRPDPPLQPPHSGDDYVRRNGSAMRPGDGYGGYSLDDDKTIATYFNPDDYMQANGNRNGNHKRPLGDRDRDRDRLGYPMEELNETNPLPTRTYASN